MILHSVINLVTIITSHSLMTYYLKFIATKANKIFLLILLRRTFRFLIIYIINKMVALSQGMKVGVDLHLLLDNL